MKRVSIQVPFPLAAGATLSHEGRTYRCVRAADLEAPCYQIGPEGIEPVFVDQVVDPGDVGRALASLFDVPYLDEKGLRALPSGYESGMVFDPEGGFRPMTDTEIRQQQQKQWAFPFVTFTFADGRKGMARLLWVQIEEGDVLR